MICQGCGLEFAAISYEMARGGCRFCCRQCQRAHQAKINAAAMKDGLTLRDRLDRWKRETPPEVHKAHDAVEEAIKRGRLARGPCEVCGAARVDGHHDDYSRPLDVRWLCRGHHLEHHRRAS